MPYTQVQFIAWEINTAPEENPDGSETYLGLANPQQDVQARCALVARALQTAQQMAQTSPPQAPGATLKVFLAPEFLLRGATGAYPMDQAQQAITTLQQLVADDIWADWVFGFGSILGTSAPVIGSPPVIDPTAKQEVYNFTLIQKGGEASQGDNGARVVMKELMSDIDFIAANANPGGMLLGNVEHLSAGDPGYGRERQRVNYDGAGIFELDGITWAVEICLDHSEDAQRLQQSPQMPGEAQVQLQLVPSCGMSIQEDSVIASPGGFIFNCDGIDVPSSALQRVAVPMVDVASQDQEPVDDSDITLPILPPLDVAVDTLYHGGAGQVVLYPPQPLPAAGTVPGTVHTLLWPASGDYEFRFSLVYDAVGDFSSVLCQILSHKTPFYYDYILPLVLVTKSKDARRDPKTDPDVRVSMRVERGSLGYDLAVWCKIQVPGFSFEGNAFQFDDTLGGDPPQTVW